MSAACPRPAPAGPYRFRPADLWWVLATPLYLLVGTARHEGAHALWAWVEGATVRRFVFWPSTYQGNFYWGYVEWEGAAGWPAVAAPYFLDALTVALAFLLLTRVPFRRRWLWLQLVVAGIVSPLVNSGIQYILGAARGGGDVGYLLAQLPAPAVHGYFLVTLLLYAAGLLWTLWPWRARRFFPAG